MQCHPCGAATSAPHPWGQWTSPPSTVVCACPPPQAVEVYLQEEQLQGSTACTPGTVDPPLGGVPPSTLCPTPGIAGAEQCLHPQNLYIPLLLVL